jgi:hypothetical protein
MGVADIQSLYEQWNARGAEFLTPPITTNHEPQSTGEAMVILRFKIRSKPDKSDEPA